MIGLVIVAHSPKVAEGICDMVEHIIANEGGKQMAIVPAGGNLQNDFGTDPQKVLEAIKKADQGDGVVIIADLGSAVISAQAAISMLEQEQKARVKLADAPFLEGAIGAGLEASNFESTLEGVIATAETSRQLHKK